ncbi:MAG: hypothetical protein II698_01865 [Ruminococcus sp.]|nr:hypothetical protein [Ruminococcus sp.]MBQ4238033.1 hypothetical protein [Ruminococcus sp.]
MDINKIRVTFKDGRVMVVEPGITFDGTDTYTGDIYDYYCFTDHRSTGPFFAKRKYVYFFKIDPHTNRLVFSDDAEQSEIDFVIDTLAEALDCAKKGPLCLFELVVGGIKDVEIL